MLRNLINSLLLTDGESLASGDEDDEPKELDKLDYKDGWLAGDEVGAVPWKEILCSARNFIFNYRKLTMRMERRVTMVLRTNNYVSATLSVLYSISKPRSSPKRATFFDILFKVSRSCPSFCQQLKIF